MHYRFFEGLSASFRANLATQGVVHCSEECGVLHGLAEIAGGTQYSRSVVGNFALGVYCRKTWIGVVRISTRANTGHPSQAAIQGFKEHDVEQSNDVQKA